MKKKRDFKLKWFYYLFNLDNLDNFDLYNN